MLILLIGPKGSGKSHIGRLLNSHLGVHFFHVEPLWMAYYTECKNSNRDPTIVEGIQLIHPSIDSALNIHRHVCVETTGASRDIVEDMIQRGRQVRTLLVKVTAPLQICMERIGSRDQLYQIPTEPESILRIYDLSSKLSLSFDIILENVALSTEEILQPFIDVLQHG